MVMVDAMGSSEYAMPQLPFHLRLTRQRTGRPPHPHAVEDRNEAQTRRRRALRGRQPRGAGEAVGEKGFPGFLNSYSPCPRAAHGGIIGGLSWRVRKRCA